MVRRCVYAGSFDPITFGHLWMIEQGNRLFDELIVSIGINPEKRYMFSLAERMAVLEKVTAPFANVRVTSFENLYLVHYAQQVQAEFILRGIRNEQDYGYERGMRYINAEFDAKVQTVFLVPPRDLIEVSSSFVKGLVGPTGWDTVLPKVRATAGIRIVHETQESLTWILNGGCRMPSVAAGQRDETHDDLRQRLARALVANSGIVNRIPDIDPLLYDAPGRHYHNLRHIRHCLAELDAAKSLAKDPTSVELAIWFHDAVYDPQCHDNEERSAQLMGARGHRSRDRPITKVRACHRGSSWRRRTRAAMRPATTTELCSSISIWPSWDAPVDEFDEYERSIRMEYQHIFTGFTCRAGRAAILRNSSSVPTFITLIPFRKTDTSRKRDKIFNYPFID